jgi:hypothetical protein
MSVPTNDTQAPGVDLIYEASGVQMAGLVRVLAKKEVIGSSQMKTTGKAVAC